MGFNRTRSLLTILVAVGASSMAASSADAAPPVPVYPAVAGIPETARQNISVFRTAATTVVPRSILEYGAPDPATGLSLYGMNAALARPAFPQGRNVRRPHFWLIPAANNQVVAYLMDRDDPASFFWRFNFAIDSEFLKHGVVSHSAADIGSSAPTKIRAVVPDSIKHYKVYWKRPGRRAHVMSYRIRNNVIIRSLRNAKYFKVAGVKYELQVKVPPPPDDIAAG